MHRMCCVFGNVVFEMEEFLGSFSSRVGSKLDDEYLVTALLQTSS